MSDIALPAVAGCEPPTVDASPFLIVRAGAELYALAGACVREVARWRAPTPVPGAPDVIPGVVSQRGVVLPVVDLRLALGLPASLPDRNTRLVVARHDTVDVALLVDAVVDLTPLAGAMQPPPAGPRDARRTRLLGAVTRHAGCPLGMLDLGALIAAVQEDV
ncbi:MAG: chemotaxis protein CheW [Chloroflexi bacterium]|nr:chemotaxis protein CheW [Chloroflexota bacterium]